MDISPSSLPRRWFRTLSIVFILLWPFTSSAFHGLSHEQITRLALQHIKTHAPQYPETTQWTQGLGKNQQLMEDLLIRATVDADYLVDTFLDAWFHNAVAGAKLDNNNFTLF